MTDEQLKAANEIKRKITELESFLQHAENVWTGRIIKQTSKYLIRSTPYGVYNEAEYAMDRETKNKVLDVLRENLNELKQQLESI